MDKLSISVAATPVKDLDVERELPMIKTGLLYGEKIKLYSISVSYLKFIHDFRKMDTKTKEYFVKELMIQINPDVVRVLDYEKELSQKRHKTAEEANFLRERKEAASQLALSLQNSFDKLEINQGYSKLIPALNANLIEMANYSYIDFQDKGFSQEFVGSIINESITGESYPMYDGNILSVIRNLIKEKELLISDVKSSQIKHIASVHNALSTLPNFHTASIKDIIDIRKELKKYLSRFRGAMMKYSDSLRNMPWDNDFSSELSLLFINEVDPCIAEIRSIVEQNSALKKFCTNILNDKISVLPLITACLNMSVLPLAEAIKLPSAIATMVSGGIIVGKNLINTHNEYLLEKKKAQENSLYFYYSLSKRIKGK